MTETLLFIKSKTISETVLEIPPNTPKPVPKPIKKVTQPTPILVKEPPTETEKTPPEEEQGNTHLFQAIGVIRGVVSTNDQGSFSVTIAGKNYNLGYSPSHKKSFFALKIHTKKNKENKEEISLLVYPRVLHFPQKDKNHAVSFQLLGFVGDKDEPSGIAEQLKDFEFKLCGLWQFIPPCSVPVISVFKNFTEQRLDHIRNIDAQRKLRFLKASHLPLLWKDAPVRPFRFNPKIEKEKLGTPSFVEVKARFLPGRDLFGFDSLLAPPMETSPKFLKCSADDKALALKMKRQGDKKIIKQ